jgi:hypothetical protein
MVSSSQKFKLYLSLSETDHRKFYWFELKGNDLYWGNSSNVKETKSVVIQSSINSISINLPDDFEKLIETKSKYSYHESGRFHKKKLVDNNYSLIDVKKKWPEKSKLKEPLCFFRILSKPIYLYPKETKVVPHKDVTTHCLKFEGETSKHRVYFDFFISHHQSEFYNLESFIKVDEKNKYYHTINISENFIIIYRYIIFRNLHTFFPENEIIFLDE